MKKVLIATLCLAMAGCNSTGGPSATGSIAEKKPAAEDRKTKAASGRKDGCAQAMQAQSNAAMLGGALGMVGSFGGFGGRGGMVASHVASTAGNMVASSQSAKAQAGVMQECY